MLTDFNKRSPLYEDVEDFDYLYCRPLEEWVAMDEQKLGFMVLKMEVLHHFLQGVQHLAHQHQKKGK